MPTKSYGWCVISIIRESAGYSWESGKISYKDGFTKDQAEILAEHLRKTQGCAAFAVPVERRKTLFDALHASLRLEQSQSSADKTP